MPLHARGPLSANIRADDEKDVLTAYGLRISGELLRTLAEPTPEGQWFRVIQVADGVATVQVRHGEVAPC